MFGFGMPELVIILMIVMVMFGASRLPELGSSLGKSIKNFKKSVEDPGDIEVQARVEGAGNGEG